MLAKFFLKCNKNYRILSKSNLIFKCFSIFLAKITLFSKDLFA